MRPLHRVDAHFAFVPSPTDADPGWTAASAAWLAVALLAATGAGYVSTQGQIPDLIAGKRLYSHLESHLDPDPYGPAVLYWYRTVRNPKAEGGAEFVPELIHNRSGVGSQFVVTDLNGDGAPDIVISCVKGTFVFWNQMRAQPRPALRKK